MTGKFLQGRSRPIALDIVTQILMHDLFTLVNLLVLVGLCIGCATNFKVEVQNRIRERSERKRNCTPLFQMLGYKQANISKGLLNRPILKFAVWLSH